MSYLRKTLFLVLLPLACLTAKAQTKVSGTVKDNMGPLAGVTVYEKDNSSNGTVTDTKGTYHITVPASAVLVFSCLGYNDVEEPVNGRGSINVSLKESAEFISAAEVVSVGYGSVARRDLTGSVGKVNMDDIIKNTTMNFDQAIAGRVAGVRVTTSDGQVGAEASIIIRGNNSLTQSSAPLYVIDGFPTESSFAAALNPSDIESVDVLKDASAAAIYGARGANGVIVITTKRGSQGKPVVSFSASWSGNRIANTNEVLDGYEFVRLHSEYVGNYTNPFFTDYRSDGQLFAYYYNLEDYIGLPYVNWQELVYRDALTQNYNVSLSGGSKSAGNIYNISFSALDQDGILLNSNFNRYSGKFSFSQDIGSRASIDINANYSRGTTNGISPSSASNSQTVVSSYLLYQVWGFRPIRPLRYGIVDESFRNELIDEEVSTTEGFRFNPAASVRNEYVKRVLDYLNGNFAFNYKIAEGLKLRSTAGYTFSQQRSEDFNNSKTRTGHPAFPLGWGVNAGIYWNRETQWLNENTVTWDKTFGLDHNVQVLAGFTFQGSVSDYHGERAIHIQSERLGIEGIHTGSFQTVTPYRRDWTMQSGLARVNYNYKHTYYLTASFRADGSSKFPRSNRWGFFPSASVAWTFSNESFLSGAESWLDNGKVRLSWGQTGNNRTTTPYDFYSQMTTLPGNNQGQDYVRDGSIVAGYFPDNMENPYLKWETTEQTDLGLDISLFGGRISLITDLYQKNTYDLLLEATLPASSGYTSAMINVGSMRNRGLEVTLTAVPVSKKSFKWTSTVNFGMNRNTVTGLSDNQSILQTKLSWNQTFEGQIPYITRVGLPTGLMYGFVYEGTYKPDEFMNDSRLKEGIPYLATYNRSNIKPGDPKYRDINGDGIIDDGDRTVIGIGQPLHTGGIDNRFDFFGFDLSVFFNWSYGNNLLNANRLVFENYKGDQLNQFKSMAGAFSLDRNPHSDIPRAGASGTDYYSSRVIEDGSFLRLKTVTLGYTLPKKVLDRTGLSSCRVYVTAENLFVITSYSGPDPEVSIRNSVLTPGFDWSAYPRARVLTGGLSLTF